MMRKSEKLNLIRETGVIAIMRAQSSDQLYAAAQAIRAPLPQLEIVPVGGVDLETAANFIRNGAAALGVGSSLINQKLLDANDMQELTRRAEEFSEQVRLGRE
jgi:2-keto-3-deoxy-6-phosphogluconate aldolase